MVAMSTMAISQPCHQIMHIAMGCIRLHWQPPQFYFSCRNTPGRITNITRNCQNNTTLPCNIINTMTKFGWHPRQSVHSKYNMQKDIPRLQNVLFGWKLLVAMIFVATNIKTIMSKFALIKSVITWVILFGYDIHSVIEGVRVIEIFEYLTCISTTQIRNYFALTTCVTGPISHGHPLIVHIVF